MGRRKIKKDVEYYRTKIGEIDKQIQESEEYLKTNPTPKIAKMVRESISDNKQRRKKLRRRLREEFNVDAMCRSGIDPVSDEYYEHILDQDGKIHGIKF